MRALFCQISKRHFSRATGKKLAMRPLAITFPRSGSELRQPAQEDRQHNTQDIPTRRRTMSPLATASSPKTSPRREMGTESSPGQRTMVGLDKVASMSASSSRTSPLMERIGRSAGTGATKAWQHSETGGGRLGPAKSCRWSGERGDRCLCRCRCRCRHPCRRAAAREDSPDVDLRPESRVQQAPGVAAAAELVVVHEHSHLVFVRQLPYPAAWDCSVRAQAESIRRREEKHAPTLLRCPDAARLVQTHSPGRSQQVGHLR